MGRKVQWRIDYAFLPDCAHGLMFGKTASNGILVVYQRGNPHSGERSICGTDLHFREIDFVFSRNSRVFTLPLTSGAFLCRADGRFLMAGASPVGVGVKNQSSGDGENAEYAGAV